jgi:spermidine synthase
MKTANRRKKGPGILLMEFRAWRSCLIALSVLAVLAFPRGASGDVIYETESPYHTIQVFERGDGNLDLRLGSLTQSVYKPGDPAFLYFGYTRAAFAALAFKDEFSDVLFIGMGGGSMVNFLRKHYPKVNIEVVEIDPVVVKVAKEFFEFKTDPRMRVSVEDGRMYLRRTGKKYDFIFLDAYNSDTVPFHLTTREFFELVRSRLKPGGAVAAHYWAPHWNRFFSAQKKTLQQVFGELYQLSTDEGFSRILIAQTEKGMAETSELVEKATRIAESKNFPFDIASLIEERLQYVTDEEIDDPVLTDDFAPAALLMRRSGY